MFDNIRNSTIFDYVDVAVIAAVFAFACFMAFGFLSLNHSYVATRCHESCEVVYSYIWKSYVCECDP
jgi:hypothetical protein